MTEYTTEQEAYYQEQYNRLLKDPNPTVSWNASNIAGSLTELFIQKQESDRNHNTKEN